MHICLYFHNLDLSFSTIMSVLLQEKLSWAYLTQPASTCWWITEFLPAGRRHVRLGKLISDSWTISTGSSLFPAAPPVGWVRIQLGHWPTVDLVQPQQPGAGRSEKVQRWLWIYGRRQPCPPKSLCVSPVTSWGSSSLRTSRVLPHQESPAEDIRPVAAKVHPLVLNLPQTIMVHFYTTITQPHLLHQLAQLVE